jgi:iron complex outermembrane receptor protein
LNVFAYANEAYRSGSNLINPLSAYGLQPGYGITNSGIGLRGADDRWSIEFWGRNVFDKRYAVGIQAASPVAPFFKIPGDPRTFGITLKGKF